MWLSRLCNRDCSVISIPACTLDRQIGDSRIVPHVGSSKSPGHSNTSPYTIACACSNKGKVFRHIQNDQTSSKIPTSWYGRNMCIASLQCAADSRTCGATLSQTLSTQNDAVVRESIMSPCNSMISLFQITSRGDSTPRKPGDVLLVRHYLSLALGSSILG